MYNSQNKCFISTSSKDTDKNRKKIVSSITLLNLFTELRNDGLIIFLGDSASNGEIGEQYPEGTTFEIPAPLNSFALELLPKYIMVTEELKQLVKNNFESPEEIWHNETKFISYIAISVSIVLGLIGIFLAS